MQWYVVVLPALPVLGLLEFKITAYFWEMVLETQQ